MPLPNLPSTLNIAIDQRLYVAPDGEVWTQGNPTYDFLSLALSVFSKVRVIARACSEFLPAGLRRLEGPGVTAIPLPDFRGPFAYWKQRKPVQAAIRSAALLDGAFLLRIPSQCGFLLAEELERREAPYAVDLLTDPDAFFAPGVSPHGLAAFFRLYFTRRCRHLCARAIAANYITGARTRAAYPAHSAAWVSSISDVELPEAAFLPLNRPSSPRPLRIINVGFLDLLYKGQDLLIGALADCHAAGLDFQLTFAGDGQYRERLLNLAATLGIGDRVHVTGPLAGSAAVREQLAQSDLFILPSRAEGIPRALLEAMAAGLPAITSDAGAMADLISPRWVVPVGSRAALAQKILEFSSVPAEWPQIGAANQQRALAFQSSSLHPQWIRFYQAIQEATAVASPQSTQYAHAV
jgi:glycosyltransferase involved in cell wall biosynthesis